MSTALPFFGKKKVRIEVNALEFVEFDAVLNQTHAYDTVITDHPVETGSNMSDHVRVQPTRLKLSGAVISNTPLTLTGVSLNPTRAEDYVSIMQDWMSAGQLVSVTTSIATYENFLLKSITWARDKESGNRAHLDIDLQQVVLADSATAVVPDPVSNTKATGGKKNLGKKPTTKIVPRRSLALKGIKALTGI